MIIGFWTLWSVPAVTYSAAGAPPTVTKAHFGGSAFALSKLGLDTKVTIYAGFVAVLVNVLVAIIGTLVLRAANVPDGDDETRPAEYLAERGDPRVHDLRTGEDVAPVGST
jgi:SSS family solute:Na+ symporter